MQNLTIENLGNVIQEGGAEALMGGTGNPAVEVRARSEMLKNGIAPAPMEALGKTFSEMLGTSVNQVNQYQVQADQAVRELVSGKTKNIHETMLAVERADISLKLLVQVRNKILDAYREIMRMQV